jgi:hypothetical protein
MTRRAPFSPDRRGWRWFCCLGLPLVAASCGPPHLHDEHPLPDLSGAVRIEGVLEQGHLRLDDGRIVRLFGIRVADGPEALDSFKEAIQSFKDDSTYGIIVRELIPGEVPAVELNGYDEYHGPHGSGGIAGRPALNKLVLRWYAVRTIEPNETDLGDPRVPEDYREMVRREFQKLR